MAATGAQTPEVRHHQRRVAWAEARNIYFPALGYEGFIHAPVVANCKSYIVLLTSTLSCAGTVNGAGRPVNWAQLGNDGIRAIVDFLTMLIVRRPPFLGQPLWFLPAGRRLYEGVTVNHDGPGAYSCALWRMDITASTAADRGPRMRYLVSVCREAQPVGTLSIDVLAADATDAAANMAKFYANLATLRVQVHQRGSPQVAN